MGTSKEYMECLMNTRGMDIFQNKFVLNDYWLIQFNSDYDVYVSSECGKQCFCHGSICMCHFTKDQ